MKLQKIHYISLVFLVLLISIYFTPLRISNAESASPCSFITTPEGGVLNVQRCKQNTNEIYLPVSLGEAIDKLTILDIKLEKIKDDRKKDVQNEYNLLYSKLQEYTVTYAELYQSMKKVNILLWDMMDSLRDDEISNDVYLKICKETIEYNDIRFRIKNKINNAAKSNLKEQKGYKTTRLLIEINSNIKNINDFYKPIKYFSLFYDEVVVIYNGEHSININDRSVIISKFKEDNTYKKQFIFDKDVYNTNEIYDKFKINEEQLNTLL